MDRINKIKQILDYHREFVAGRFKIHQNDVSVSLDNPELRAEDKKRIDELDKIVVRIDIWYDPENDCDMWYKTLTFLEHNKSFKVHSIVLNMISLTREISLD